MGAMTVQTLSFTDSPAILGREDRYAQVRVKTAAVLESWRGSLFSFEWLDAKGALRGLDDLPLHERDKRLKIERALQAGEPLARPVLGIGILDNVEIGAGRDVFLTLAAHGMEAIEVYIPAANAREFKKFLA
jgi:hypothetical protein